jgi:hypothetical protein
MVLPRMTYSIQRIRKGKNNRAANWANRKIGEQANFNEERAAFHTTYPGQVYTNKEIFTVIPAVAATAEHEAWPAYEFIHKPPFRSWDDFAQQARDYFLTTETRDMAIKKLRNTTQKGDIEEYLTEFKGWANLAGFDDVALVDQFKTGLKKGLGRRIMETGNPGDGTTPGQLQEWYKKALENPEMDWKNNQIKFSRCPGECYEESKVNEPEDEIDQFDSTTDKILAIAIDQPEYIWAKSNFATDIADANQVKRSWKEIVPKHYLPYKEVFEKQTFDQLPPRRPWDHAIELTPGAKMVDCKIYPLNPSEQKQLDEFLKEQLETGRIQPSKSPMASPFFFVKKKDGTLRPVQDY